MKKVFLFFVLTVVSFVFVGCSSDDDDNGFDYDVNMLIGKWQITEIQMDGKYVDVTKPPYYPTIPSTYATFKTDGSYYGSGYFGTGSGTYKTKGKRITCYVEGTEYARYDVLSLSGSECELNMSMEGNSLKIKCKKQ